MRLATAIAVIALAVALSGCNQQPAKKNQSGPLMQTTERGRGGGLRKACASELQQYCAGDQRGRARRECLQTHMAQLGEACKTAIESRGGRRGGRRHGL